MYINPHDPLVVARVIKDESEWDNIQTDWNDLFSESTTASPPLDFVWLRSWWRCYKSSFCNCALRIVTVWRDNRLIGALPLFVHSGMGGAFGVCRLGLMCTGEAEFEEICPDYMNILYRPGEETASVSSVWHVINTMKWDYLELLDLPKGTPLLNSHAQATFSRGNCPVAQMEGGFLAYLERLSSHSRNKVKRLLRDAEKTGVSLETAKPDNAMQFFDCLMKLHQARWVENGKSGVFAAPRFVEFHRGLVEAWLPAGRVILARICINSVPFAVLYGFINGKKFDFYQCGIKLDRELPLRSPGNVANLLLIKHLSEWGLVEYDFLRGSSSYKSEIATSNNALVGLRIWKLTPRAVLYRFVRYFFRLCRKVSFLSKKGES